MANSFFNTVGGIFSNIFQGRNKNAIIVPPHKIFTGEFPEVVPKEKFYDYYYSWPQIKSSINPTAKKLLGAGIEITSNDERATEMLNKWCDIINFKQKLGAFVTDALITGDGFFEKQFTESRKTLSGKSLPVLGNIEQVPTKTFWKINRDPHAQFLKYVQLVDGAQNELSPEYIIHWAINNPDKVLSIMKRHFEKYGKILGFPDWVQFNYALKSWSSTIKKQFNNQFQCCPNQAEISHHILYKSKYPALSLNVNNGIALCKKCHNEVHGWKLA